ncbi:hypothetical protein [Arsenicicoccus piscis]|uniref:hypothetical protein n=1 Tax=Arsenicicoccus piscis TaxID=673954 RepID=UPI0024E058AE|nr:hypothetical protein [Arsenicicoccus piscis]
MNTTSTNPRVLLGAILGIPTVIALMLLAFAAPALHSGAKDLPWRSAVPRPPSRRSPGC